MAKLAFAIRRKKATQKTAVVSLSPQILQQEIEKVAYQLFAERGHQHGFHVEDWLRAEEIVRSRRS